MTTPKTIDTAIIDLFTANRTIAKRHKYNCGIETDQQAKELKDDRATFFFLSPDRQDSELYQELKNLKWLNKKYEAGYYWQVRKDDIIISYTEGDVYITIKPNDNSAA